MTTLVDILRSRSEAKDQSSRFIFRADGVDEPVTLSFEQLDRKARAIAAVLQELCSPGDRALLLYPQGLDYVAAFYGCLYAGVIAVPAYPPDPTRLQRTLPRLQTLVRDSSPSVVLTIGLAVSAFESMQAELTDFAALRWLATDELTEERAEGWKPPRLEPGAMAFLQYTSGSTSTPRGVRVTHANLLYECRELAQHLRLNAETRAVFWVPMYHDLGLVGGVVEPVLIGCTMTFISPIDFLKRPRFLLEVITKDRATVSGGPNFSYDLCIRKTSPDQRQGLNLSSWITAFNVAEPVRAGTLKRFEEAFSGVGFSPRAWSISYGLAEATLVVTSDGDLGTRAESFDTKALGQNRVELASGATATTLISNGRPLPGSDYRIVHPSTRTPCNADEVGEIWVTGPGVADGYWNRSVDENARIFSARVAGDDRTFLRTGDLGFSWNGDLYMAGRLKDLIILRGRNHYPQDLEEVVEREPGLRAGCSAAFSSDFEGEERLVIVCEVERRSRESPAAVPVDRRSVEVPDAVPGEGREDFRRIIRGVRQRFAELHQLEIYRLVLVATGSIPKTTSGKIQRQATRAGFLERTLEIVAEG